MKKLITNKSEKELANLLDFNGKYVSSLIKKAQTYLEGNDVPTLLKNEKKRIQKAKVDFAKRFGLNPTSLQKLSTKAQSILSSFHTGHSMGCYRTLRVQYKSDINTISTNHHLQDYSRSSKWRATHGDVTIVLKRIELQKIQNIEGIWTIINSDGTAKWLAEEGSKNRHEVTWVDGFCVGKTHSIKSREEAEEGEAIKLQKVINAIESDNRFIGHRHIKMTGACEVGIDAYCRRNNLNKDFGYNLGYLKSLEFSNFFNKIQNESTTN